VRRRYGIFSVERGFGYVRWKRGSVLDDVGTDLRREAGRCVLDREDKGEDVGACGVRDIDSSVTVESMSRE